MTEPELWRGPEQQPVQYGYVGQAQPLVSYDRKRNNTVELVFAIVLTVLTVGYFIPWLVAAARGRQNSAAIGLINFLVGWTLIGWVAALVMACQAHAVVSTGPTQMLPAVPGWYPADGGLRYWDGSRWTEHRA